MKNDVQSLFGDPVIEYDLVDSCTSTNSYEVKLKDRKIDLDNAEAAFSSIGESAAKTPVVLLFKIRGHAISVYASGRMLIKNITKKDAESLGRELVDALEKQGALL